ncbi:MAG: hypothetical protein M9887_02470 [Chitinophagales bacterium]|nr:hypothetical protein [Chitinophagales bacterium]
MLKKFIVPFSLVIGLMGTSVSAQESDFVVNEIQQTISQGEQTGLEVFIPEVSLKTVQSTLSKWTKSNKGKYIASKKSEEIFQDNVMLTDVSDNTVDMYTYLSPENGGVKLKTFVDLGGAFLSSASHPEAFQAMGKELEDFARNMLIAKVNTDISNEEKALKKLQSDLKSLESQNDKFHKDIAKNQDNIQKQELAMKQNELDQKSKEEQINIQQQIVLETRAKRNSMSSTLDDASKKLLDGQVKTEEKSLKKFQDQLKKLKSQYSSSAKSIQNSKTIISQRERDITKNESDHETKLKQIEIQNKIIDAVNTKKSEIK